MQWLVPNDWRVLSSAIVTHALLNALERYANHLIASETEGVAARKDYKRLGVHRGRRRKDLQGAAKGVAADPEKAVQLPYGDPRYTKCGLLCRKLGRE